MAKTKGKRTTKYKKPLSTLAKPLAGKRKSDCKKRFTSKCNSEFLREAYRKIHKKQGYRGIGGGFSINQRGEALRLAAQMKKGAHYSSTYKKQIKTNTKQKKKTQKKKNADFIKNYPWNKDIKWI